MKRDPMSPQREFERKNMAATLDAARLSHERGADAATVLLDAATEAHVLNVHDGPFSECTIYQCVERLATYAALSVPAPTLPALDAEKLAKALVKATRQQAGEPDGEGWPGYVFFGKPKNVIVGLVVTDLAEAIADEYDRLSEEGDTTR